MLFPRDENVLNSNGYEVQYSYIGTNVPSFPLIKTGGQLVTVN